MQTFTAKPSIWRLALLLLGAIMFVIAGVWIAGFLGSAPDPGKQWIGWLSIAFFGPCALLIAARLFDRADQLVISERGIMFKQWSADTIPWTEVTDIGVYDVVGQKSILLRLKQPDRFPSTSLLGKIAGANRAITGGDIAIQLGGTDGRFDSAMAAATHFWEESRQKHGTPSTRL